MGEAVGRQGRLEKSKQYFLEADDIFKGELSKHEKSILHKKSIPFYEECHKEGKFKKKMKVSITWAKLSGEKMLFGGQVIKT